jgi:hypothetical protein
MNYWRIRLINTYRHFPLREDTEWQAWSNQVDRFFVRGNWWRLCAYLSIALWLLTLWLAATGQLAPVLK